MLVQLYGTKKVIACIVDIINDIKHQIYDIYLDQCTLTMNTSKMVLFFGMRRPNYLLSSILFKQQHNPLHFCSVKHGLGFSSLLIIFQMF